MLALGVLGISWQQRGVQNVATASHSRRLTSFFGISQCDLPADKIGQCRELGMFLKIQGQ